MRRRRRGFHREQALARRPSEAYFFVTPSDADNADNARGGAIGEKRGAS
jgi:hypothetical protein